MKIYRCCDTVDCEHCVIERDGFPEGCTLPDIEVSDRTCQSYQEKGYLDEETAADIRYHESVDEQLVKRALETEGNQ